MDEVMENPERELFFWCILLNYQQMARIFWRAGIDYIGSKISSFSNLHEYFYLFFCIIIIVVVVVIVYYYLILFGLIQFMNTWYFK